jgi:FkbM family methyltransferase
MSEEQKEAKIYQRAVNRLTAPALHTLSQNIHAKIEESERATREIQLGINHDQTVILDEIKNRVKNSGTLVLSEREMISKIFSGLIMYLDPQDMAIAVHIALDGIWEHRITAAWLALLQPTDTVFDIGANNGYYGALAAQKTDKKQSKVVLFEANPNMISYIRKTLAANWLNEQSVIENVAVADKPGTLTLSILKDYIGSSSIHSNDHVASYMGNKMYMETAQEVTVKAIAIDEYCKEKGIKAVDMMIMDIEGYEDKAYVGMRKTIAASPRATLFIEFTQGSYEDPVGFYNQMLADFGYVYTLNDEGYIIKPEHTDYQTIIGDSDDWVMPIFSKRSDLDKQ